MEWETGYARRREGGKTTWEEARTDKNKVWRTAVTPRVAARRGEEKSGWPWLASRPLAMGADAMSVAVDAETKHGRVGAGLLQEAASYREQEATSPSKSRPSWSSSGGFQEILDDLQSRKLESHGSPDCSALSQNVRREHSPSG